METKNSASSASAEGVEFTDEFQHLDGLISAHDSEGDGPLRKGGQAFQWSVVEPPALALAAVAPDLRVGLWLLRAGMAQRGLQGLAESLTRLANWIGLPAAQLFPRASDGDGAREVHALHLSWLASAPFMHQLRVVALWPGIPLTLDDLAERVPAAHVQALGPLAQIASALVQSKEALARIDAALREESDALGLEINLPVELLNRALKAASPAAASVSAEVAAPAEPLPHAPPAMHANPVSRDEVRLHLDRIIGYFKDHEPGHPAPIFLMRIQRMLGANFQELMSELYPDAKSLLAKLERPQST